MMKLGETPYFTAPSGIIMRNALPATRTAKPASRPAICLFDGGTHALEPVREVVMRCGFATWTFDTADVRFSFAEHPSTLCLVVDLPSTRGASLLALIRQQGMSLPAILVTDRGIAVPRDLLTRACVIDVLQRPLDVRALLKWIECVARSQTTAKRAELPRALAQRL
jgi:FixJ family two-component response regulator